MTTRAKCLTVRTPNELEASALVLLEREVTDTRIELEEQRSQMQAERERNAQFRCEMLAIVGHDMRAPLGAILFTTEMLAVESQHTPASSAAVTRIVSFTRRMTRMVDQLVDLTHARLGSGIPLARTRLRLSPLIQAVLEEIARVHPGTHVELTSSFDIKGVWDEDRLRQVLFSVLCNAIEHGLEGAPIRLSVGFAAGETTVAVVNELRDGAIPAATLATLFEPYRRGWDSDHAGAGLGLGLFIAREIMRAHGGDICVASSNVGTELRITLPTSELIQ